MEAFAALLSMYSCCVINIPAAKTRVAIALASWDISFITTPASYILGATTRERQAMFRWTAESSRFVPALRRPVALSR
jgi:hypothetical protein